MKGCNYIREQIDGADKPDVLSFEVTEHIGHCADCERFAGERASLRKLLASGNRVTAPMNFDAMLNSRLAEAKTRKAFSWLSPAGYLRLGAATAALAVMIFAAQYTGLLSNKSNREAGSQAAATEPAPEAGSRSGTLPAPGPMATNRDRVASVSERDTPIVVSRGPRALRSVRSAIGVSGSVATVGYSTADDGGVVLLRGQNGSVDVPMPAVSVGAQPLLYVSAGQKPVRNVGTSF